MATLTRRGALAMLPAFALLGRGDVARAAQHFEGKTISILCGYNPGGGVDLGTRLIAENIGPYIPGQPKVIVQNMEGAAGIVSANFLYSKGSKDGLTLGVPGRDWLLKPMLNFPNARFDPLKFNYIGSTGETNVVAFVNAAKGVRTAEELRKASGKVLFGGLPGATVNTLAPALLGARGWPIEVIRGYAQTALIVLAMERGELDAIYTPESSFARRRDLIDSGKVLTLFQSGRMIPDLPSIEDLIDPQDRELMRLAHGQIPVGMPLVAPPGVAPEIVEVLRAAFMAMATDPKFEAPARRIDEPFGAPLSGAVLQERISRMVAAITPQTVEAYAKL
ncbi:MAG TPA: tripartite tricarboxylate transporter substrate-binding protein [Beijerinckiaceae bacterium]